MARGRGSAPGAPRTRGRGPGPGERGWCFVWSGMFFWPRSLKWCFYGLESSPQWNGVFSVWNGVFFGLDHPPFPYRPPSVPSFPSLTKPSLIRGAELGGKAMVGTSANKSGTDSWESRERRGAWEGKETVGGTRWMILRPGLLWVTLCSGRMLRYCFLH